MPSDKDEARARVENLIREAREQRQVAQDEARIRELMVVELLANTLLEGLETGEVVA